MAPVDDNDGNMLRKMPNPADFQRPPDRPSGLTDDTADRPTLREAAQNLNTARAEQCSARFEHWGQCVLPAGHNMGHADVPQNHEFARPSGLLREAAESSFHELHIRYNHSDSFTDCDRPLCADRRALLAATEPGLDVERAERIEIAAQHLADSLLAEQYPVWFAQLKRALAAAEPGLYDDDGWRVHNHGPEEGRGIGCREYSLNGRLVGACKIIEATSFG